MHTYLATARHLFITDWMTFKQHALSKCGSVVIWGGCQLIVGGYFLPELGITSSYGIIALAGCLALAGFMDAFGNVMELVVDLETDKLMFYYATLPVPVWVVFVQKIASLALFSVIQTLTFLPVSKILLWNMFDISTIHVWYLAIAMIMGNVFYAAFTLFIASFVKTRSQMSSVWRAWIFPLWFLGGFGFSWGVIYKALPWFAYVELLNPIIYISESYRVVFLGQQEMLNFWLCVIMIGVFTVVTGWIGIKRLKQRCDFV